MNKTNAPKAPAPGEAKPPAPSVAALLRRNASNPDIKDRPAVKFGDEVWTHAEYFEECLRWATWLRSMRPENAPFHLGVLMENTPVYLAALGGAAIAGATLVGLNDTRRGDALVRDIDHTDVAILVVQADQAELVDGLDLPVPDDRVFTTRRYARDPDASGVGADADPLIADTQPVDLGPDQDVPIDTTWCLVLTSGTTSAPKAVICSQKRMLVTGERMRILLDVTPEDVGYIAMPLFHSNSLMVGLMPALVAGGSVGLARKFTASGWVDDVRHYGSTYFNYTGKPLSYIVATPERPDDADNPVRRAFGNEGSPEVQRTFSERFDVKVTDMFGPTEGGVGIGTDEDTPPGSLGPAGDNLKIVDDQGVEKPVARFDDDGRLLNADECVGEIVNTAGPGPFEGYYGDEEAYRKATRKGWYWTGDLGYVDEDGYLYFAGRTSDWLRVDGENFPAGPIQSIISRHPDVVVCAVYGVPDESAGDQVMATLVLSGEFDPMGFAEWLDSKRELGPKWHPRYVRVADEVPRTATNKILVRNLQHEKFRLDRIETDDQIYVRGRGEDAYRPFTQDDLDELHKRFADAGRERFWDL